MLLATVLFAIILASALTFINNYHFRNSYRPASKGILLLLARYMFNIVIIITCMQVFSLKPKIFLLSLVGYYLGLFYWLKFKLFHS